MALSTREPGRAAPRAALPRAPLGARILGAVLLLVGLFLLREAVRASGGDLSPQGPWLAPVVVTGAWVAVAFWYLVTQFVSREAPERDADPAQHDADQAERGADQAEPDADPAEAAGVPENERARWLPPALLAAALGGYLALLEPLGFVLASALFIVAATRILGSRKPIRELIVAVALPLAIHLACTRLLELRLPSGVLPL